MLQVIIKIIARERRTRFRFELVSLDFPAKLPFLFCVVSVSFLFPRPATSTNKSSQRPLETNLIVHSTRYEERNNLQKLLVLSHKEWMEANLLR